MGSKDGGTSRPPSPSPRDHISELSCDVLRKILCSLPLDNAVRTSALASRWHNLWSTNPVLHLTDPDHFSHRIDHQTYVQAIRSCVQAYSGEILKSFSFHLSDEWPDVKELFDYLLLFAADHKVEELSVMARIEHFDCREIFGVIETPPSIFLCSRLHTLRIVDCSFCCFPSPKKDEEKPSEATALFPALTSLVLCDVEVDDDQFSSLLASCPLLKTLGLSNCQGLGEFVIDLPNLERFCLFDFDCDLDVTKAMHIEVVNAPNLKWFSLQSDISLIEPLRAATNLAEVTLIGWKDEIFGCNWLLRDLLWGIPPRVESLAVNDWFLEPMDDEVSIPSFSVFMNLKELHICIFMLNKKSLGALVLRLGQFELLENLVVHGHCRHADDVLYWEPDFGHADSEYADLGVNFPSLKKITILDFSGTDEEMKLIELIINKGVSLESVFLFCKNQVPNSNLLEEEINSFSQTPSLPRIIWHENSCCCRTSRWGNALRRGQILG